MSEHSSLSQDSPSTTPEAIRGGALGLGPLPMFLMDVVQPDAADRLQRSVDLLKDDALEAADVAVRAPDPPYPTCVMPCAGQRWMVPSKLLPP